MGDCRSDGKMKLVSLIQYMGSNLKVAKFGL